MDEVLDELLGAGGKSLDRARAKLAHVPAKTKNRRVSGAYESQSFGTKIPCATVTPSGRVRRPPAGGSRSDPRPWGRNSAAARTIHPDHGRTGRRSPRPVARHPPHRRRTNRRLCFRSRPHGHPTAAVTESSPAQGTSATSSAPTMGCERRAPVSRAAEPPSPGTRGSFPDEDWKPIDALSRRESIRSDPEERHQAGT